MNIILLLALLPGPAEPALFSTVPQGREVDYGHRIIDDIESRVPNDRFSKPKRNQGDKGNWVHEQTHYLNARIGIDRKAKTGIHGWTGAYVLGGQAFVALQPKIKLADVGAMVPESRRGYNWETYFNAPEALKAWNDWPLYVLDEATAAANALEYEIATDSQSLNRSNLASEWSWLCLDLIAAIEKDDPHYKDLPRLKKFIEWHNARIRLLVSPSPTYRLH